MKRFLPLFLLLSSTLVRAQVNTDISNGITFDGEPYLAMDPQNPQHLVAAWMGLKLTSGQFLIAIKTRVSFDGGSSWSTTVSMPHFGTGYGSADVSMAFSKTGLLYISYIDYRQSPDSGGIYVARSTNGGLSWDAPSKAFDMYDVLIKRPVDRPWLVVDRSGQATSGTLYITTKPAPWIAPPNRPYFKASSDSGHTWTTIAPVDGGIHLTGNVIAAPMAAPAVTAGGAFCALYPSYVASQNPLPAFYLAKSYDKGQSFSYYTVYTTTGAGGDTNLKNGYQLIADPSDSNRMVFLSPGNLSSDQDIYACGSTNGGQTWNTPLRINDDAVGNGKAQDMIWSSYNEKGQIAVTWRDRRNAGSSGFWNTGYDFYYATSTDNGLTFSANKKLSGQLIAFDSIIAQNGNDFMSSVYRGDTLYTLWGDTRNGKMNIYFTRTIASSNTSIQVLLLNEETKLLRVAPNPAKDKINVSADAVLMGKTLTLHSATGTRLNATVIRNANTVLDLSSNAPGIYFLRSGNAIIRVVKD